MIPRLFGNNNQTDDKSYADLLAENQEFRSKLDAISRSQAVIEFQLDGTIITANENFLAALGYSSLDEIVGHHHRMFVDEMERSTDAYRVFWETLGSGTFQSGEFMRVRRDGQPIWIQAMYYPLADAQGRPVKVVKFASDITGVVRRRKQTQEIGEVVSTSIEQIVSTIGEISGHVSQTAMMATTTKQNVESTSQSVTDLNRSSQAIERILEVIRSLADQTNLLALNATIESARAGEAGKGFAVVANEVKTLAQQTAKATDDIDTSINEIRNLIQQCVTQTAEALGSVSNVAESMTSIASAVEEQSVTMSSLSQTSSALRDAS